MSTEQLTLRGAHTTETFHFIHPEYGQVTLNVYYTDCGDGRTDEEAEVVDANGDEIVDPDLLQELCDYVDSLWISELQLTAWGWGDYR